MIPVKTHLSLNIELVSRYTSWSDFVFLTLLEILWLQMKQCGGITFWSQKNQIPSNEKLNHHQIRKNNALFLEHH